MKITGTAVWAFLHKPKPEAKTSNGTTIPSMYTINVILDDIEHAKKMKKRGFNIKKMEKDAVGIEGSKGSPYLQIKSPAAYKDGNPTTPPEVVDSNLKPLTCLVGNGSKVNVVFVAKDWEKDFGNVTASGVSASLRKVQVLELVPYEKDEDLEVFEAVKSDATESTVSDDSLEF